MHAAPAVGTGRDLGALDSASRMLTPEGREILPPDLVWFRIFVCVCEDTSVRVLLPCVFARGQSERS